MPYSWYCLTNYRILFIFSYSLLPCLSILLYSSWEKREKMILYFFLLAGLMLASAREKQLPRTLLSQRNDAALLGELL